ncbi:pyridoxal phosphate-dependent transferase [Hygrophoropsis aurantiaca]|uniref:Pyridoxal phosphate-dependent transferase n=1 Tax=Hygrophoropsis aurantiaca TaxID=72124 RepID=A0ACB8AD64_9AGAM|nr:pyridoxal phosphate-dependent transferase [Hygrophoropsis aurantiaca]
MSQSAPDLSHHLSKEARERLPNPMKDIWRRVVSSGRLDVANMANGDPHYSLFPFKQLVFEVPSVTEAQDPVAEWRAGTCPTQSFRSYKDEDCALSLRNAFQYTHGAGLPQCQKVLKDLTDFFFAPPNHTVTLTLGNSDGITKLFRLLGDSGDYFLTDEFSFPGMTNAPLSCGIKWVGIKMDAGGIIPEEMEKILKNWDETKGRRPHVLYIVPVGQNPTGSTLSLERRQKIYCMAQKWDLLILEDDPYYFLQYDLPPAEKIPEVEGTYSQRFAKHLIPTILSLDVDGRVLRVDSFSKILAPGMRLGWITSNKLFHKKLVTYTDSGTQHPHGFGQAFITEMLGEKGWHLDGLCRWLQSLRLDYKRRRDFLLEMFRREVEPTGYATVNIPQGGMFVWMEVHFERHPHYRPGLRDATSSAVAPRTNIETLLLALFEKCMENDVVVMPSSIFSIPEDSMWIGNDNQHVPIRDRTKFFRATFAGTEENIEKGMVRFGRTLKDFFEQPMTVNL